MAKYTVTEQLGQKIGSIKSNVKDTLGRLSSIRKQLSDMKGHEDVLSDVNNIINKIKQNESKGEQAILSAIGQYKTWDDLDRDTIWLEKTIRSERSYEVTKQHGGCTLALSYLIWIIGILLFCGWVTGS